MRFCPQKIHQKKKLKNKVHLNRQATSSINEIHHRCHIEKQVEFVIDIRHVIYKEMSA